jgi:sugar lactone lactonase YvrE
MKTCLTILLVASDVLSAQQYTIATFAGGALPVNISGTSASLGGGSNGTTVALDSAGNLFLNSPEYNVVLRLSAQTGALTLVAGNGTAGFSGDNGPATSAQLNGPAGVAVDSLGNIYIADSNNNRIRKVSNGTITTVAGNGDYGFSGDNGPATSASLTPYGLAADSTGTLYIADFDNSLIRKVSNGVITTVAGDGTFGFSGDNGPPRSAQLYQPTGVAVDSVGNIYIADTSNNRIRKVSNGVITTLAGNGTPDFGGDGGPATSAEVLQPTGVAVDSVGNVYLAVVDRVRRVSNGIISTVAGGGSTLGDGGPAINAQLVGIANLWGITVDPSGNLFIADGNQRIRKVSNGLITTVAGGGATIGDGGPAAQAQLASPRGVALDSTGNMYIADTYSHRIRKVSNGAIATVAGNGSYGFSGDNGPATMAQLDHPSGVAVDPNGNLYVIDYNNFRIRKVSSGLITTVAGGGSLSGDSIPATSANLSGPLGIAVDLSGNLYISDESTNRVRKVSNGVITTIAGNGTGGFAGDNGPATSAQLSEPSGLAVDSAGNLYIADTRNARIRRVSGGVITTLAGGGSILGDGVATDVQLGGPTAIALDSAGNVYIADIGTNSNNNVTSIRKVSNGVITTIAGSGAQGVGYPAGIAVGTSNNVYISDSTNNRVRVLTPSGTSCTYSVTPTSLQAPTSGGSFSFGIQTTTSCSWTVSSLPNWITVSGVSSGSGPGTVTLVVTPNTSSTALSATISIAGVSVTVTQAATTACTYLISPGGQAFAAVGGNGTITVTAGAGCSWTAATSLSFVTISGATSGTGNGAVSYAVAANSGGDRTGTITIAGLSFDVEQVGATLSGFTNLGSMAQVAFAGAWTTTFTLVNTGTAPVQARLNFFDNNGNPLPVPLVFPQLGTTAGPLLAATLDRTVNPGAGLLIQTAGLTSQPTQVGWAQLLASANLGSFAVFQQAIGASIQEAVVPLENRNPTAFEIWFDNTGGHATGIALASTGSQAATVPVVIHDDTGAVLLSTTIQLAAGGHASFDLAGTYAVTSGRRGTVEFDTPSGGQISVLGLRFNPTGAFSTVPALTK